MIEIANRLRSMSAAEIAWRLRTEVRTQAEAALTTLRKPQWRREDVRSALALDALPDPVKTAAQNSDWSALHTALRQVLRSRPSRFALEPSGASMLRQAIRSRWPEAEHDAVSRAAAVREGRFDLLGYRSLTFVTPEQQGLDWHFDPVHQRRMPMAFWSRVPYLDPSYGDHKIVWELNRKQHWLVLSRALWLTGDVSYARDMQREFAEWMAANPPLMGANWASMLELGFRSLSWLWGLHAMLACEDDQGAEPWLVDLMVALDKQLTHVEHNLSLYFSPNTHLTGEALALYVVGAALPELAASTRWLDVGRSVLLEEIDRQIEQDGGHVERSTHYHRYTLDFYLLALLTARRIGDADAEARFTDAVERLAHFAAAMADRQGRLPRIGDDDGGRLWPITARDSADIRDSLAVAAAVLDRRGWSSWGASEEALWLTMNDRDAFQRALDMGADDRRIRERRTLPFRAAERRGTQSQPGNLLMFPSQERRRGATERRVSMDRRAAADVAPAADERVTNVFTRTGYITTATPSGDHLVLDAGPHGYLNGGHAHADALSLTLTLRGKPLLVDPGTPTYTMDPVLRDHLRSSASHNTLTIDGMSSAVPAGPFHWRSRADAQLEVVRQNARLAFIQGRHDSYGSVGHRRIVLATEAGYVFVDQVVGSGTHEAAQHWHFDPQWRVLCESSRRLRLVHEGGEEAWMLQDRGDLWLVYGEDQSSLGWVSPAYGVRVPAWTARVTHAEASPFSLVTWCAAASGDEVPAIERLRCDGTDADTAVAVRLQRGETEWTTIVRSATTSSSPTAIAAGGFETDGRALQLCVAGGEISALTVVDATYVQALDGSFVMQAEEMIPDLHAAVADGKFNVTTSVPSTRVSFDSQGSKHVRYRRVR